MVDNSVQKALPIPKKDCAYTWAKQAEYLERDLDKAKRFYWLAIRRGERAASAVKDLASILHQQHQTEEAYNLLLQYSYLYRPNSTSYLNLVSALKKQLVPTGKALNTTVKISPLPVTADSKMVEELFENPSRIRKVEVSLCSKAGETFAEALLRFDTHSAARKTLDSFKQGNYCFEWTDIDGHSVCPVIFRKKTPQFSYFGETSEEYGLKPGSYPLYEYFSSYSGTESENEIEGILYSSVLSYYPSKLSIKS